MKFTGNKDTDRMILNQLDDKDLVNVCMANKTLNKYCNDEVFWRNRIGIKFPYISSDILNKYKGNKDWSNYYINDLRKIYRGSIHLIESAGDGRLDHVIISLNKGTNIHAYDDEAFRMAALFGHLDVVKYLVEKGANIHAGNDSALQDASENGYLDMVKYLIERGANIHANNDYALKWAAINGELSVVKYLVEKGANIHGNDDYALKWAAERDHQDVVDYLKSLP